jgi:hypothetical protein
MSILRKGDFTIKDLLAENVRGELMKEFRARNRVIIALLAQQETLKTLIAYIVDSTKTQNEQFSACELLTADISPILGMHNYQFVLILSYRLILFTGEVSVVRSIPIFYFNQAPCNWNDFCSFVIEGCMLYDKSQEHRVFGLPKLK